MIILKAFEIFRSYNFSLIFSLYWNFLKYSEKTSRMTAMLFNKWKSRATHQLTVKASQSK